MMLSEIINVRDYSSLFTEKSGWTEAFRRAVEDAEKNGGGIIYVPPGKYVTYSIQLKSNITLYVSAGAELSFMEDIAGFKSIITEFEGRRQEAYMPCIYAYKARNVSVKGDGVLNGNGHVWWKALENKQLKKARPNLICFEECEEVKVEDVLLRDSPSWTVHLLYCDRVSINGISIKNPAISPNTDGINPDGCSNVRISNCVIDVGDDCIAIKAGTEETPRKRVCENIIIENCNMLHGHGGVVIGSEMSGGVKNINISNCIFQDTDRGLRIKTRRGRGGIVENIHFHNIIMEKVLCPFVFNMYYCCGENGKTLYVRDKSERLIDERTPILKDFCISNVSVTKAATAAGFMYGLKEMPIRNVTFSNVRIEMDPDGKSDYPAMMEENEKMSRAGFFVRNAEGIVFDNVKIENVNGAEIDWI